MKTFRLLFFFLPFGWISCHSKPETEAIAEDEEEVVTPVTVTTPDFTPMAEFFELNATSTYLRKSYIKANINGYIRSANLSAGQVVGAGQTAFVLKTKEAQSIGNTINLLDTSFKFTGIVTIRAGAGGYVSEVNHQEGDYVQEGEQLAVISDTRSFVFILNMPYELRPFVMNKEYVELLLPDGRSLPGKISSSMPIVDSASQTQNIIITVADKTLPINLIAKVKVTKEAKTNALSLPKQSVLSDEAQTSFWVMKVIDSTTAVKVQVKKGMEINDRIEILSPVFTPTDKFLLTGNFGLADTAKIRITEQ
ncbi:MAG TPA: HlyD family efflux transporter periplasmic adaptor subunit [Chitinophagaceae bacterium]|nr:HlyD family efflux transporter periplasmic adaptor subunit [Chitinophagaceae bacterium]